ncbi:unnamed protein product, partial [Clonostachys rosea f. rosea IK726]
MAALSHGFDYLVHAVLGLAASHLTLASRNEVDYSAHALSHRVQAINSLNTALSKPCASRAEGDARFATLMALTFQSSYMPDGMVDFLAMIRGCTVVPGTGMPSFSESVFQGFSAEAHQQSIIEMNEDRPEAKDQRLASFAIDGLKSLYALRPFCPEGSLEGTYLDALEGVLELTIKCPLEGKLVSIAPIPNPPPPRERAFRGSLLHSIHLALLHVQHLQRRRPRQLHQLHRSLQHGPPDPPGALLPHRDQNRPAHAPGHHRELPIQRPDRRLLGPQRGARAPRGIPSLHGLAAGGGCLH